MTLAKPRGGTRYCAGCGARLAHDNAGPLCSPCRQAHRNLHNEAPLLGSDFWATDQMRDALASKDMSVVVRAYRRHPAHGRSPLPQADVAYWLGISQGQLSRIEAGRNSVRDLDKLVNYARRLHIPSELLWFEVDDEPQRPRGNGLVRLPGGPPVSAATARTEPALAESLLIALDQYAIMDNLAGPYSVLPVAEQQMRFAEQVLGGCSGRGRIQMIYVCARFAEFTGWLHQDTGDLTAAMRWSNTALDFAQEAGDIHLVSYIKMRKSNIASDARRPDLAMAFARSALRNPGALTPRLRAVAYRAEAHGHALIGNYGACARALDQAFQHASDEPCGESNIALYCTGSYVEMEAAHCWIELRKPAKAIATLQQGLANWPPDFHRDLGMCLARLVVAHAEAGRPDEALTVAEHALVIAADTRSRRTAQQLHRASVLLETVAPELAHRLRHTVRTALR